MRLRRLASVGVALAALGAGCTGTPSHLLFYQGTVIGVDVATSPEQNTITAKLGYDRQTGTIIPKTSVKKHPSDTAEQPEAMSILARARFKIRFLQASEICERFATGEAARNMARQGAGAALATPTQGGLHACSDW